MLITVSGSKDFDRFADALALAATKDFDREMDRGLKLAGEDIAAAVRADSEQYMPSGYEEVFASRLLTRVETAKGFRGVTVIAYAKGRSGRRDVERLDIGQLRHPVYGRYRTLKSGIRQKNPWTVTKIRPGFFTVPVRLVGHRAVKLRGEQAINRLFAGISKSA